jgi:hypothetical protein
MIIIPLLCVEPEIKVGGYGARGRYGSANSREDVVLVLLHNKILVVGGELL